jgi:hypothetical protein
MNTTSKQKHLAACLRGSDHQRLESKSFSCWRSNAQALAMSEMAQS